jgi:hypothetical protein
MAKTVPDLTSEWDKEKLRNWMANAKRLGRDDVYQAAFRQLCRVEGRNIEDPLEAEFAIVMRALIRRGADRGERPDKEIEPYPPETQPSGRKANAR